MRATRQQQIADYLRTFTRHAEDLDAHGQVDDGRTVDIDCTPLPRIPIEALALTDHERKLELRAWYYTWQQWTAGLDRLQLPAPRPRPCTALPASELKIGILAERAERGESLFDPDDRDRQPGVAPASDRRRKGVKLFDGGRTAPGFQLSAKDHEDLDRIKAVLARARGLKIHHPEGGAA